MAKLTEKVKSLFRWRKPLTQEDAADIADWVNEGGAFDPEGPPRVAENRSDGTGQGGGTGGTSGDGEKKQP